jgi:hypothetical protein
MPAQMIYGKEDNGPSFLQSNEMAPPHYSVKSDKLTIEKITQEVQAMTEYARDKITQARIVAHERVNKNRITNDWAPGDVVFVLDRAQIPGNTRPLKTKFCSSPCVIVRCLFNTSLVRRLSDNFVKILLHKFQEFLSYDFTEIAKHDPFEIPNGIQLFDPVEDEKDQENKNKEDDTDTDNDQKIRPTTNKIITPLADEFYSDDLTDNSQIPYLNSKQDIADDLAQLYEEDPPQAPEEEEEALQDEDSSTTSKPNLEEQESDPESEDDIPLQRRLRGARAKKTVRFPDMSAFITAW